MEQFRCAHRTLQDAISPESHRFTWCDVLGRLKCLNEGESLQFANRGLKCCWYSFEEGLSGLGSNALCSKQTTI